MKRIATLLLAAALLVGGCKKDSPPSPEPPPEPDPNFFCADAVLEEGTDERLFEVAGVEVRIGATHAAIVGGEPADEPRATMRVIGTEGWCSGTLYNKRTIVWAAHCLAPDNVYTARVEGGQSYTVISATPTPDWEPNVAPWYRGDLAVGILDRDVTDLEPVAGLWPGAPRSGDCRELWAMGYGYNDVGLTGKLQQSKYRVELQHEWLLFTSQRTPGGICFGDSGGNIMAEVHVTLPDGTVTKEYYLAGVTSWTRGDRDGPDKCTKGSGHIWPHFYKGFIEAQAYKG